MGACCASTGFPLTILKDAKRAGCPAFRWNRVYLVALLKWMNARAAAGGENVNWDERMKRAAALKAELDLEEASKELVKRSEVRATMDHIASRAMAVLTTKFESELPPKQDGFPAAEIASMNRAALREVRTIMASEDLYAE